MDPGTHECGIESGKKLDMGVGRTRGLRAEGQHLTAQSFEVASLLWKELDQEEGRPVAFPPAAGSSTNVIALRYVKYSRVLVAPAACRPQPMHK